MKNIGDDLKTSILILFNKIKRENHLPSVLRDAVISAIPKNHKNPLRLENQRGIFLTNKVKSVLMKLVHNSIIDDVEDHLSESNIGARKDRSTRDHVFVINAIINEVKKDKTKKAIDLVFYDIKECYDSLWLEKTLVDLSKNGVKNDLINLLYEKSKSEKIKVKTPVGDSKEMEVEDLIMQGESISSILCTSSMDKMSQESDKETYKYRNEVKIPKL